MQDHDIVQRLETGEAGEAVATADSRLVAAAHAMSERRLGRGKIARANSRAELRRRALDFAAAAAPCDHAELQLALAQVLGELEELARAVMKESGGLGGRAAEALNFAGRARALFGGK